MLTRRLSLLSWSAWLWLGGLAFAEEVVAPPELEFGALTPSVPELERLSTMEDRLSFELSFTNVSGAELEFEKAKLDYFDANGLPMGSQEITDFLGDGGLRRDLQPDCNSCTGNEIPAGSEVLLRFFLPFERKLSPASLDVSVEIDGIAPLVVSGVEPMIFQENFRPYRFPLLNPTARNWAAFQGHDTSSNHRVSPTQRYAYDLVVIRNGAVRFVGLVAIDGKLQNCGPATGTGNFNACYFAWEEPIYAAADGIVVRALDGKTDNPPGVRTKGGGNVVVIDHGNEELSFHAHLREGTVAFPSSCTAVELVDGTWLDPDDEPLGPECNVSQGELLGRVGNSGNSGIPHLHVHLIDDYRADESTLDPTYGDPLPFHFTNMSFDFGTQSLLRHLRGHIPTWNKTNNEPILELDPDPLPPPPAGMGDGPGLIPELEPNDDLSSAQKVEIPVTVTGGVGATEVGILGDGGDGIEDVFAFQLDQVSSICARLSFDAGADLDMVLYDEKLHAIRAADAITLANPERLVANLLPGSYYLMVTDFDATQIAGTESYTLFLKFFGGELKGTFEEQPPSPFDPQIAALLDTVERLVATERFREAMAALEELRSHVDGCGTAPDGDDWVSDCGAQEEIRRLIDEHLADLDPDPPEVFGRWVPLPSDGRWSDFKLEFGSVAPAGKEVIGVVRAPSLEGLTVLLKRRRRINVSFNLRAGQVTIGGPAPELLLQELTELGGLRVPVGQLVKAKIRPSRTHRTRFRYDAQGRLLMEVPRATLTVIDSTLAPHKGTLHVNPQIERDPIGIEGDYQLVPPEEQEGLERS